VTYGRMAAAWSYYKQECCLLRLILWNPNEQGRGCLTTSGRGSHCTS
jgi:hypothetical protein